jgi:hypothetical protein
MCFYIQKLYYIEIISMRCEFVIDDNLTIWFSHASEIYSRHNSIIKLAVEEKLRRAQEVEHKREQ